MPQRDRKGLPSASSAHRWMSCPGSHLLGLSQPPPPPGPEAELGTVLHAVLAGEIECPTDLTDDARMCLERCRATAQRWIEMIGPGAIVHREWLHWLQEDGQHILSGQADVLAIANRKALIIDYKTGRAPVEDSATNRQLLVLAVLAADAFIDLDTIYVGIIQPLAEAGAPEDALWAVYSRHLITSLRPHVIAAAKRTLQLDAPRSPGTWCTYCRARAVCPELAEQAQKDVSTLSIPTESTALSLVPTGAELDAIEQADKLWRVYRDARREQARQALANDPTSIPGWTLAPGRQTVTCSDAQAAFARVAHLLTADQFAAACTLSLPRLAQALYRATPNTSQAAARRLSEQLLSDLLTVTHGAPRLTRADAIAALNDDTP